VASRQEQEQQEEQQDAKSEVKRVEEAMADWWISTPSLFFQLCACSCLPAISLLPLLLAPALSILFLLPAAPAA